MSKDIDPYIKLTLNYSQIPVVEKIIKCCSLFPIIRSQGIRPVKQWKDPFGCKFILSKTKGIQINKFEIDRAIDIDKYSGLAFKDCLKITNKICILYGYDEFENKFIYYNCYCIDEKLRSYFYYKDTIERCSSLLLGYDILSSFLDTNISQQIKTQVKVLKLSDKETLVIDNYPLSVELEF